MILASLFTTEMVAWHHQLNGHEFEQTPGEGDRQGCLVCCSPWCHKESDMTATEQQLKTATQGTCFCFIQKFPQFYWQYYFPLLNKLPISEHIQTMLPFLFCLRFQSILFDLILISFICLKSLYYSLSHMLISQLCFTYSFLLF